MATTLVEVEHCGLDLSDERSEAQMLHQEDVRSLALRDREYGGHSKVQSNIQAP